MMLCTATFSLCSSSHYPEGRVLLVAPVEVAIRSGSDTFTQSITVCPLVPGSRARSNLADLLGLPGLDSSKLLLPASLAGLGTSLGVEHVVPPPEAGGIVANELLVVHVVVVGAGPEGEEVPQAPGEVVAAVGVDGLEESEDNPHVHGHEVEITGDSHPDDGRPDDTRRKEHDLDRRRVLGGQAEGSRVCVVQLVDRAVQRAVVKPAVEPVVPGVLHHKEDGDLESHLPGRGEGHAILQAEPSRDGVEEPDLGQLNGDVLEEDKGGAIELFLPCRDFLLMLVLVELCERALPRGQGWAKTNILELPFVEERDRIDDDPRQRASEINELVHDEAHDTGSECVILHPKIPSLSCVLEPGPGKLSR